MLEKGVVPGAHLIHKAVSNRFFELVAETLDDKRIQIDGLRLLDLVRAHEINASYNLQNRLLAAWKGRQLPGTVVEYLVEMKHAGVSLSKWAYRSIVVACERSDPEFALTVCNEMEGSGIQLYREAYNAALGIRLQLGMHNAAHELFMKRVDHAVAPNSRTYSIMIRVYSFSGQHEKTIAIFETMRGHPFEPDHIDYHHAIRSCIMIQRVEYAVKLYRDASQAKLPLPASTYVILSRACERVGWKSLANKFEME
ncbi:unnamed protein product [Prorocentrum cordatum]|uniref:Pentacotripeptide-repeat region of PRORP domain-containing protein n=1 Tax=Prorocentrum cordatum TaxID=2364126 RepID=A0ABN9VJT2_9DINO|nr:unnamed protein product [Polarella glacialis]